MNNESIKLNNQQEETAPELNVLIIAHKKNQLASAASFLGRRGIPCAVRGNIKEGIQYITSQKATIVFLSWNLPHANIIKTYQILSKTFHVDCVVFAERGDGKTAAELNASQLPDIMHAPVSGPGFNVRIQKILKTKENLKNGISDPQTKNNFQQQSLDDKIVLKNSSNEETDDHGNFINLGHKTKNNSAGMINFQSPRYSESDYELENTDPNVNDISEYLDQQNDLSDTTTSIAQGQHKNASTIYTQKGVMAKTSSTKQDAAKESSYGSVVNVAKKDPINNNQIQYEVSKPEEAIIEDFKPRSGSKTAESLLAQKTFEAIEKAVRPAGSDYTSVGVVSKIKIFNIHSPRFRGYLIFVVPMFCEFDRAVVSSIKSNLENLLNAQNEYMLFFEELNVEIEQVDFLKWAQSHAEFFIQTVDNKTEIICAYYPYKPSLPKLDEENEKMISDEKTGHKMTKVQIEDLKLDTKTNFNLYIHLPKNNKFICYIKPGDVITKEHKDKFINHKVDKLHIKRDEIVQFKEYFVSNQLNKIIGKKTGKKTE